MNELTEQLYFALREIMRVVRENPNVPMHCLKNGGVWQQAEDVIQRVRDVKALVKSGPES